MIMAWKPDPTPAQKAAAAKKAAKAAERKKKKAAKREAALWRRINKVDKFRRGDRK